MENEIPQKKKRNVKTWVASLLNSRARRVFAGLAVLVVATGIAVVTGFMTVVFKQPSQKVVVTGNVCNQEIVTTFNDTIREYYGDGSTRDSIIALEGIVKDISQKNGNQDDPTCVFIKYRVAFVQGDYSVASKMASTLQDMAQKGQSVSMSVDGLANTKSILQSAEQLAPRGEEIDLDE